MHAAPLIAAALLAVPGMAGLAAGVQQLAGRIPELLELLAGLHLWLGQAGRISQELVMLAGGLAALVLAGVLAWTALQSRAGVRNRHDS